MPRPRLFDEAEVKSALRDVFWQHGYEGASYADIMAATGLQKGSLYASFGDKRALYQHALSDYNETMVSPGVAALRDETIPSYDRIAGLFDALIATARTQRGRWGCLLCNAAIDQAPFDATTETTVTAFMNRLREAIADCVHNTPAWDKAEIIWTAYFGGHVLVKAGFGREELAKLKTQALELFD